MAGSLFPANHRTFTSLVNLNLPTIVSKFVILVLTELSVFEIYLFWQAAFVHELMLFAFSFHINLGTVYNTRLTFR